MIKMPADAIAQEAKRLILSKRECVAFLGAGMSVPPAGDWKDLVKRITEACTIPFDDNADMSTYPELIDKCIKKNVAACDLALRDFIPSVTVTTRTAINLIHRFDLKAILTTNFDPWIQKQSREFQYKNQGWIYPDLPLSCGIEGRIYYIHGCFISTDSNSSISDLVLSKKSFQEAYAETSLLPGFLLNTFVYENILFVGFNPTEPHISKLLRHSIKIREKIPFNGSSPKRYMLLGLNKEERDTEKIAKTKDYIDKLRALEIEPVFFDGSKSDFSGIEELLESWVKELDIQNRPSPFGRYPDL
jgi:hypothetical protein